MGGKNGFREPTGFASEDEVITVSKGSVPMGGCCLGGKKPEARLGGGLPLQFLERIPNFQRNILPVVESGPAHLFVLKRESERTNEVQGGSGRKSKSSCRSGIVRDLGVVQDEVEHFFRRRESGAVAALSPEGAN